MGFTHLFIAHSSQDESVARRMLECLESDGIKCWIAPRDITLGVQWAEAILDAIEGASGMLLVFSAKANESPQVLREIERAVDRRVPIYPVKIEDVKPSRAMEYYLSSHQWKEVDPGQLEERMEELIPTIKSHLGLAEGPAIGEDRLEGWGPADPGEIHRRRRRRWVPGAAVAAAAAAAAALLFGLGVLPPGEEAPVQSAADTTASEEPSDTLPDAAGPSAGDLFEGPLPGMVFAHVPAGSFTMGASDSGPPADSDELPAHRVEVDAFEMMTTEVTQEMWVEVMGENPSFNPGEGLPVESVSWSDCRSFADSLNELDPERGYRLPTEAEWEYACRAGTDSPYFWGADTSSAVMDGYCWYSANSGGRTHPVALKSPNPWGLRDMAGNVLEWCTDAYHPSHRGAPGDGSARPPVADSSRVVKGGSARNSPAGCRCAARSPYPPDGESPGIGFRLVRSPLLPDSAGG
jgi:formylglycine-generating enzyme required for sulfatase activity